MTEVDLKEQFPRMKPVRKPPPLMRINGCGTGLYGHRDDASGTYVGTLCLCLVFVPVLCLRAYRVARANTGGWYFLGREPLSTWAKAWNLLLVGAILSTVAIVQYDSYTSTPAYKAHRRLVSAQKLAHEGKLTEAAKGYEGLALAGADESASAATALRELTGEPSRQAPLGEAAGVFASAARVARRGDAIPSAAVADGGMKLAADKGDADPRGGVALLDAVRPLVRDTRPVDARRLELLQKWAAAEPDNLEQVVFPLASLLEQGGKTDEAKKLLLPHRAQLQDNEGARVLGTILARERDYDGAYALLWPYVKNRLDALHAAATAAEDTEKQVQDREIQLLREDKGPPGFAAKYESAAEDERHAMVRRYINDKLRADPEFARAQAELEKQLPVVPVALELGIVMLQRAQGEKDAAARKAQLESAEQVFLAIGGVAGESDAYRINLGQVYFWLGKQAEGHKEFDDYLASKNRAAPDLLAVAGCLREVGSVPEARTMAEEAYGKAANGEERFEAARFRALCFVDSDDRVNWLRKSDTSNAGAKAELAKALGDQAMEQGHDADAAAQYHAVIDALATVPRNAGSLNLSAIAYESLFQATGDHAALERSGEFFQQAVDLKPNDPILLSNAGSTLLGAAVADVVGADIDLRALHEPNGFGFLGYLYDDQAGRDALAKRVKDHPGVARALSYLNTVTVLSPKDAQAFMTIASVHRFTRDDDALAALVQKLRAANLDTADALTYQKEYQSGEKDQQRLTSINASIARDESLVAALRLKGGRTAAVALDQLAGALMRLDAYGGKVDADRVVSLADEALHLSQSSSTVTLASAAHLFRAAKDLCRKDPAFEAFYHKYQRTVGTTLVLGAAAAGAGPEANAADVRKEIAENPDVRRAVQLQSEDEKRYREGASDFQWALLKAVDPEAAEKEAQAIRALPRRALTDELDRLLQPVSPATALDSSWFCQIEGKPEDGKAALRKVEALGIPVPGL